MAPAIKLAIKTATATATTVRLPTATAAIVTMLMVSMLLVRTQTPPDTTAKKARPVMAHAQKVHPRRVSVDKALMVQDLVPEQARVLGPNKLSTSPC